MSKLLATLQRKPEWLKVRIPEGETCRKLSNMLGALQLHTVCEEALCPNRAECWGNGTATFMLMGSICTRNCNFCSVKSARHGEALDESEPRRIADAVRGMSLQYAVLTSVDRDDLPDFGAGHFAECISEIKKQNNGVKVEALIPDFRGRKDCLEKIAGAKPDVIGHNIEVVERLQGIARDAKASYMQSLSVLRNAKLLDGKIFTKSSIMLGLGETCAEVLKVMDDLLSVQCDFLTLGQYLQPTKMNLPVVEFVVPEKFAEYREIALQKGFRRVESGPLVRSSYKAGDFP